MHQKLLAIVLVAIALTGCAVNPVTGKREIVFVSEGQEIQLGTENYAFMQQAGGGDYDVDPGLTNYVQNVGNRLAAVSDRPLPYEFTVLNSSVPNAWALPGGKIAINRGLLTELNSEAELAAVLGHEIVHAAARHSAQQMERGIFLQAAILGTAIMTSDSDYGNLAVGGANVAAQLLNQAYGRGAELESDLYGMRYMSAAGYDPQGAVELQETFVRLSEGRGQSNWLTGLFASHPPSQERVAANRQTAASLPPGGETGADRYRAALRQTIERKPAYDAYDEGRKALAKEDHELALRKAEEAIGLFGGEAHFYGLRGDARFVAKRYDTAIQNYDIAIRRRDDFFQYYLQRGLANSRLGNDDSAVNDLEKSNSLFPTAVAHNELGGIAARRGQKPQAIQHYSLVAGGSGPMAAAARENLARLDLADNPARYIQLRCFQDNNGNLGVTIGNASPVTVTGIRVAIVYQDAAGPQRTERALSGRIAPGQAVNVSTGIGPFGPGVGCPAEITAARVAN